MSVGFIEDANREPVDFDDPTVCRYVVRLVNADFLRLGTP
jgi:hypothetical protein